MTVKLPLYPFSTELQSALESPKQRGMVAKYPWHSMDIGQAFVVPETAIAFASMCTLARRTGARLGKKFVVFHHKEHKIYEVGRIANPGKLEPMPTVGIQTASNVLDEVRKVGEGE